MLNDDEFRRRFPHDLVATNLPGVFCSSAPPQDPMLRARFLSLGLREQDRVIPKVDAQRLPLHRRYSSPLKVKRGTPALAGSGVVNGDLRWAGSVLANGPWSGVTATWSIPHVYKPQEPPSTNGSGWWVYTWIGLDGLSQDPVPSPAADELLQIGIGQQVEANGNIPAPFVWYFWLTGPDGTGPSRNGIIDFPVAQGDGICCIVEYLKDASGKNYAGGLYIANGSGKHVNLVLNPPQGAKMPGTTAEWIVEDPGGGYPSWALAGFTQVLFLGGVASGANGPGYPDSGAFWQIFDNSDAAQTQIVAPAPAEQHRIMVYSTGG